MAMTHRENDIYHSILIWNVCNHKNCIDLYWDKSWKTISPYVLQNTKYSTTPSLIITCRTLKIIEIVLVKWC